MTARTPGPWAVRDIPGQSLYIGPANDGGAPSVAIVRARFNRTHAEMLADAQFIVRACNNHDALVTACAAAMAGYPTWPQMIHAAYAKATEWKA